MWLNDIIKKCIQNDKFGVSVLANHQIRINIET